MTAVLDREAFRLPESDPRCGTIAGYGAGCGCDGCKRARSLYMQARKQAERSPLPPVTQGSWSDIARLLRVTNNQVFTWAKRRHSNGFPEPVGERLRGSQQIIPVFDINEVLTWYSAYDPVPRGAPRGERNGLSRQSRARRARERAGLA